MAKEKAVYSPGELSRVRNKLGSLDDGEAKRMAKLLGGEVGVEKSPESQGSSRSSRAAPLTRKSRQEKVEVVVGRGGTGRPRQPSRSSPGGGSGNGWGQTKKSSASRRGEGGDDPRAPVKASYWERVKMDRCAAQPEFDIKSPAQALLSVLSPFSAPADTVSSVFVTKRMAEYYKRLETLVTATRVLLPRNNPRRIEILKKKAPFAFAILETIRTWNIDKIASDLAKIQNRPRSAMADHFAEILRVMYRPLFVLELLDTEVHIKGAFKLLYKLLYLEDPGGAKEKYQESIRLALASYATVRRDIHYLLYPLLMKLLSDRWFSYEAFFKERKNRFLAFIGADEVDRIEPPLNNAGLDDTVDLRDAGEEAGVEEEETAGQAEANDPAVLLRKAEQKAVTRGLDTLESLFPKAGWDQISDFPDLYPYFGKMFDLSRGYEQISPLDPLHQMIVLARILEELFFGLRSVSFGVSAPGLEDSAGPVNETMTELINNWHYYLEHGYYKEYLPRVREYVRILEGSMESRNSTYAKRLLNELHWSKKLFFLPYYKFESFFPPPFQKKSVTALYPEIRKLRKYLTAVATGIEMGMKQGGADKRAPCPGINNPWATYEFQVPNPLSQRLGVLLQGKPKNNATLIFFTLAVTMVLDYLVNNEESWAYASDRPAPLFRGIGDSVGSSGKEKQVDADALFHASIKNPKTNPGEDFVPEPLPADASPVPGSAANPATGTALPEEPPPGR